MFVREISEWRSIYEGYKGSWSPEGGYSLPPEDPDNPRRHPSLPKGVKSARKGGRASMEPPEGVISSTGSPRRRPAPPAVPADARKRLPAPSSAAQDLLHLAKSKAAARTPAGLRDPKTFK